MFEIPNEDWQYQTESSKKIGWEVSRGKNAPNEEHVH